MLIWSWFRSIERIRSFGTVRKRDRWQLRGRGMRRETEMCGEGLISYQRLSLPISYAEASSPAICRSLRALFPGSRDVDVAISFARSKSRCIPYASWRECWKGLMIKLDYSPVYVSLVRHTLKCRSIRCETEGSWIQKSLNRAQKKLEKGSLWLREIL